MDTHREITKQPPHTPRGYFRLDCLPQELFLNILSGLKDDDLVSLVSFSLTCRSYYNITSSEYPLLFKKNTAFPVMDYLKLMLLLEDHWGDKVYCCHEAKTPELQPWESSFIAGGRHLTSIIALGQNPFPPRAEGRPHLHDFHRGISPATDHAITGLPDPLCHTLPGQPMLNPPRRRRPGYEL